MGCSTLLTYVAEAGVLRNMSRWYVSSDFGGRRISNPLTGVLVSGKGTRFILANTEQLHAKIFEMSERIRCLEDALESLQSQASDEPHPLMASHFMGIKSTMGLYNGSQPDGQPTNGCSSTTQKNSPQSFRGSSEETFAASASHVRLPSIIILASDA